MILAIIFFERFKMITTIKSKIVLTAILFITVFSISAYAVDKKYIPNTANAAISF